MVVSGGREGAEGMVVVAYKGISGGLPLRAHSQMLCCIHASIEWVRSQHRVQVHLVDWPKLSRMSDDRSILFLEAENYEPKPSRISLAM